MLRIQGNTGDLSDEKKKAHERVVSNFVKFGLLIAGIKLVPYALKAFSGPIATQVA